MLKGFIYSYLYFKPKLFISAILLFSFLVIFGTLSHEYGHIVIAKFLGYETTLHYGSMSWFINGIDGELIATKKEDFLVTMGGIFQTTLTGTIGLLVLYFSHSKLSFWIGISLTLFWSREIINLIMSLSTGFLFNQPYFGGDELIISKLLDLPNGFIPISLGFLGLIFCLYAVFKINIKERLSFVLGGAFGGIITYIIWFGYLGKILLP